MCHLFDEPKTITLMNNICALVSILLVAACATRLDPLEEDIADKVITAQVTLNYTGSLAVDGCEFFVNYKGETYKPLNEDIIEEKFKSGSRDIKMKFVVEEVPIDYQCGLNPTPTTYKAMTIISISE